LSGKKSGGSGKKSGGSGKKSGGSGKKSGGKDDAGKKGGGSKGSPHHACYSKGGNQVSGSWKFEDQGLTATKCARDEALADDHEVPKSKYLQLLRASHFCAHFVAVRP
jgi:hypothetical protein